MDNTYLTGQLLIAMPNIGDPRFDQTVIFMCAHSEEGAMGLVINKPASEITFDELLEQTGISGAGKTDQIQVYAGGPVETGRGFVLHSSDYQQTETLTFDDSFCLTTTVEVLQSLAEGTGPENSILALGYAGWGAGQLDGEIQANGWLNVAADPEIVFEKDASDKWAKAIEKLGIDPGFLAADAGRA